MPQLKIVLIIIFSGQIRDFLTRKRFFKFSILESKVVIYGNIDLQSCYQIVDSLKLLRHEPINIFGLLKSFKY